MKDYYVSYECAKRLRALGFRWKVDRYYTYWYESEDPEDDTMTATLHRSGLHDHNGTFNNPISEDGIHYSAPRLDQAAAWLREKHHLSVEPICNMVRQWNVNVCMIDDFGTAVFSKMNLDTYELALSAGLDAAIELLGREVKE